MNAPAQPIETFESFDDFWPYYLREHSDPTNRALHFAGTTAAIALLVTSAATLNPWLLPLVPVAGYGPAWVGHFLIEKNRPATFQHPLWSLRGDLRMYRLMWCRQLGPQLERALAA